MFKVTGKNVVVGATSNEGFLVSMRSVISLIKRHEGSESSDSAVAAR